MKIDLTYKIEKVIIYPGDIFDFDSLYIESYSGFNNAILVYKRRKDNVKISFSTNQAMYFTVNGKPMQLPSNEQFETTVNNHEGEGWNNNKINGINFVDSFTVLKGHQGVEKHHPNLDINQSIIGFGLDWMLSSIEKKNEEKRRQLYLENEKIRAEEQKRIQKIKIAEEEEVKFKISKILAEEEEKASIENSHETLTRHFLKLNQEFLELLNVNQNEKHI